MTNARQITSDIKWVLEDNMIRGVKVKTSVKGSSNVTSITGPSADRVIAALREYVAGWPGVVAAATSSTSVTVTQPL